MYWTEEVDDPDSTRPRLWRRLFPSRSRQLVVRVADYAHLPERIGVLPGKDALAEIDLGKNTTIVLAKGGSGLGTAVARYLELIAAAARTGEVPAGSVDPDLASRAPRALPQVARVTAQGRGFGQDLHQFRSALFSATPHAPMTAFFIVACVLPYIAMVASGVDYLFPTVDQLLAWGADQGFRVVLSHEYWRLFTHMFLHSGIAHLAMNMWSLYVVGPLIERLFGNVAFAAIYLASGVGGALASLFANPFAVGVGASGAICGTLGALAAFLLVHRRAIPASILRSLRGSLISVIVIMAILGLVIPNIDHQVALGRRPHRVRRRPAAIAPWPVQARRWLAVRRFGGAILIASALAAAVLAIRFPPLVRYQAARRADRTSHRGVLLRRRRASQHPDPQQRSRRAGGAGRLRTDDSRLDRQSRNQHRNPAQGENTRPPPSRHAE